MGRIMGIDYGSKRTGLAVTDPLKMIAQPLEMVYTVDLKMYLDSYLYDEDGNRFIDFAGGIAVLNSGHRHPAVMKRVQEQLEKFTHTCFMVTPYSGYVEVCEALNRLTPGDHEKRSALFNTGAEAVENAIKIARAYTGRSGVVDPELEQGLLLRACHGQFRPCAQGLQKCAGLAPAQLGVGLNRVSQ